MAARDVGFTGSATATRPRSAPSIATYTGVRPDEASRSLSASSGPTSTAARLHQRRIPDRHRATVHDTHGALPRHRLERLRCGNGQSAATRLVHDGLGQRVLAERFQRCHERQEPRLRDRRIVGARCGDGGGGGRERRREHDRPSPGRPSVTVPVLSSTTVVHVTGALQRLAALDQHAELRALAGRDHHRRRHGKPHRARTGDDQHRDRRGEGAHGGARRSAARYHTTNVSTASAITTGTKTALMRSARRWMGARDPCASRISATICASTLSAPSVVAR